MAQRTRLINMRNQLAQGQPAKKTVIDGGPFSHKRRSKYGSIRSLRNTVSKTLPYSSHGVMTVSRSHRLYTTFRRASSESSYLQLASNIVGMQRISNLCRRQWSQGVREWVAIGLKPQIIGAGTNKTLWRERRNLLNLITLFFHIARFSRGYIIRF